MVVRDATVNRSLNVELHVVHRKPELRGSGRITAEMSLPANVPVEVFQDVVVAAGIAGRQHAAELETDVDMMNEVVGMGEAVGHFRVERPSWSVAEPSRDRVRSRRWNSRAC